MNARSYHPACEQAQTVTIWDVADGSQGRVYLSPPALFVNWSERQGSNLRCPGPKPGALPLGYAQKVESWTHELGLVTTPPKFFVDPNRQPMTGVLCWRDFRSTLRLPIQGLSPTL